MPEQGDLPPPDFVRSLAAGLPVQQIRRAVAIALAIPDVALRGEFIRALRDRLALPATGPTGEALSSRDPGEREDAVAFAAAREAVGSVLGRERLDAIVAPVRLIRFAPEFGRWLRELFPIDLDAPPEVDPEVVLALVSNIPEEAVRMRALALLAPVTGVYRDTVELTNGIQDGWRRVTALALLALRMPGNATRQAIAAAESISEPAARVTAIATLAPYLAYAMRPLRGLVGSALEQVGAISTGHEQARALAALAPTMRGFFPELVEVAHQRAVRLRPASARSVAVEALALPWAQPYIARAAGMWTSESPFWTAERLEGVTAGASPGALDAVLRDIAGAIGGETEATPRMDPGGGEQAGEPTIAEEATRRGFAGVVRKRERYVNLGFASRDEPGRALGRSATLAAYYEYVFWVEIGQLLEDSIVVNPSELLPGETLPAGARVSVALFGFPGHIAVEPYTVTGEMEVQPDGTVRVLRQPADAVPGEYYDLRRRRLFFHVRAPDRPGVSRLRCNIYYERNLVQSHLVHALVTRIPQTEVDGALAADVDYTLAHTLDAAHLRDLAPHKLSIMLNRNDNGSHSFMFLGKDEAGEREFHQSSTLTATELQNLIRIGRSALRKAAWGNDQPWSDQCEYRYEGRANRPQLLKDLPSLARAGYRLYVDVIKELTGGRQRARDLAALMRTYGLVQIALKERPEHVFPAALLYDAPLDSNADLSLCPTFLEALDAGERLETATCFADGCPAHGDLTVVCPSGFWGYRHALGLPVSTHHAPSVPTALAVPDGLEFLASVSTDPIFVQRIDHLDRIRARCAPARWEVADTRARTFDSLKRAHPHLVYFFCHGGLTADSVPFLEVGPPSSNGGILSDNLVAYEIGWDAPRPIVFLNGCHTTALEPEAAISFVSTFVEDCAAAGVVGTEITIFEDLAVRFAEECFERFFVDRLPFGESVRRARLALLREANPLGLVYIPYVQTGLHLA